MSIEEQGLSRVYVEMEALVHEPEPEPEKQNDGALEHIPPRRGRPATIQASSHRPGQTSKRLPTLERFPRWTRPLHRRSRPFRSPSSSDINPVDYLRDVLIQIDVVRASEVHKLTPRGWKADQDAARRTERNRQAIADAVASLTFNC